MGVVWSRGVGVGSSRGGEKSLVDGDLGRVGLEI